MVGGRGREGGDGERERRGCLLESIFVELLKAFVAGRKKLKYVERPDEENAWGAKKTRKRTRRGAQIRGSTERDEGLHSPPFRLSTGPPTPTQPLAI